MGASITLAGESLIAQKQTAQQPLIVSRFVLANVPGLDPNAAVNRAAPKPPVGQIVASYEVTQKGFVNPNQVVYSLMMGSDVGDFDWNWIGLETADNVLLAVAYVPVQQKRRNIPPLQLGNNVTRNFLVVFDGAQVLTGITIDASTWQHDFTVRLKGVDERERLSNRDLYGRACFFSDAFKLERAGEAYQILPGMAYIEGVRLAQTRPIPFSLPSLPNTVYLDVVLQRELSDVVAHWQVVTGQGLTDYVDSVGVQHYRVPIVQINTAAALTDMRPVERSAEALIRELARRDGDYASLRARGTRKEDVGLSEVPNAVSSDLASDDPQVLATTQLVSSVRKKLDQSIGEKLPLGGGVMVGTVQFEADNYTYGWARGFDFNLKGKTIAGIGGYGDTGGFKSLYMALGDKPYVNGNGIRITEAGVDIVGIISGNGSKLTDLKAGNLTGTVAVERLSGTYKIDIEGKAASATKLANARTINRVAFDGTADITIVDDTKLSLEGGTLKGDVNYAAENYTFGWARGFNYFQDGKVAAGIGGMGNGGTFTTLFMGLGDKPYVSGNGLRITQAGVDIAGVISGNGSKLTDLKAGSLTGTVAVERLSGTYKIDIEGKAASATKLANARTINRVMFDGTADITVQDDSKLPLDGGMMKGNLMYSGKNYAGGWARGLTYETQGASSGGMGGMGSDDALQVLYMALGATPYNSGSGIRVTPGHVSFEGLMSGTGGGLSNLDASSLAQGIIPVLRLLGKSAFGQNDYVRIPDVPGGLIIQFGMAESYPNITNAHTLPVAFPNRLLFCCAQVSEVWSADITVRFIPIGNKLSQFYLDNSSTVNGPAYFFAIGY